MLYSSVVLIGALTLEIVFIHVESSTNTTDVQCATPVLQQLHDRELHILCVGIPEGLQY